MERKIFDTNLYWQNGSFNRIAFENDLGSLATEASTNKPYWERIHYFSYTKISSDWIIDAHMGDAHISNYFSDKTDFDRRERDAGIALAETLVHYAPGTVAIHISSPGGPLNYEEGRIQIGLNRKISGITFTESYGIPTPFPIERHIHMGIRLTEVSEGNSPRDTEELRDRVFIIHPPEGVNPWEFVSEFIPLEKAWQKIVSGEVIQESMVTHSHAKEVTAKVLDQDPQVFNSWDAIRIGAHAEQEMAQRGYQITGGNCGKSNMELLNQEFISGIKSKMNMFRSIEKTWSYHPDQCVYCKKHKDKVGPCGLCEECEDLPEFN